MSAVTARVLARARRVDVDAPLALWLIDLCRAPVIEAIGWLSHDELRHAQHLVSPRHRDRYLNAHIAMRAVLETHCGVAACLQHFVTGRHGKPLLTSRAHWHFSLSYAGDVALLGIAFGHAVGVDVERDRHVPGAAALSSLHFQAHERHLLAHMPFRLRRGRGFLRIWTRQEACLKALGQSLLLPPTRVNAGATGTAPVTIDGHEAVVGSCIPCPGYTGAWACLGPDPMPPEPLFPALQ